MSHLKDFNAYRARMNARIMASDSKVLKRFFNLDTNTYLEGALDVKTKELLGLSASMTLRCDDCIKYHVEQAVKAGATEKEIIEVFEIALVVGGSIVIPYLRHAFEYLDEALAEAQKN